jgi:hypothetical protein
LKLLYFRPGLQVLVIAASCLGTTGCWHRHVKAAAPPLPPPQVVVPLAPTPEPETPPQVASVPETPAPLPTQSVQPKVKKPKKKIEPPAAAAPTAPVEVASAAAPPAESVIGALTAGGDASPAQKQKATDAISGVEKRLAAVSGDTLKRQEDGVKRVQNFLRQAHEALKTGDAEAAMTLAIKAKVLLDDLLK